MATSTPNHGLYKYGGDDSPDLTKLGPTMDKIDLELKKNADNIGLFASDSTMNTGVISSASTTSQFFGAMKTPSIMTFSHYADHTIRLTDMPSSYGQVLLAKGVYVMGIYIGNDGSFYVWNNSSGLWKLLS